MVLYDQHLEIAERSSQPVDSRVHILGNFSKVILTAHDNPAEYYEAPCANHSDQLENGTKRRAHFCAALMY